MSSHKHNSSLKIFNINDLVEDSVIKLNKNIPDYDDCLFLIFDYTVVTCIDGIFVISNITKEIVQFIEIFPNKICLLTQDDVDSVYVLNIIEDIDIYKLKIIKLKMIDSSFVFNEEYEEIRINKEEIGKEEIMDIICLNKKDLIIRGKNIYILKEENNK